MGHIIFSQVHKKMHEATPLQNKGKIDIISCYFHVPGSLGSYFPMFDHVIM